MTHATTPLPALMKGRITTQPVRIFAFSLYISIFLVELLHWSLKWCGDDYQLSWLLTLLAILGIIVVMDWGEQRFFTQRPSLLLAVGVLGLRIFLIELAGIYSCSGFHSFFAFIPPLLAYLYIGWQAAYLVAAINIGFYLKWVFGFQKITVELLREEDVIAETFIFLVGMVLMLMLGRILTLEERNRQRAEALVVELEQSQRQIADLAAVAERNRIARDIHDSVGHHLTAVSIQLEKAITFRPINPNEADQAIRDAKRSAQAALHDVRDSVSALRDPDHAYELAGALRELVAGFGRIPVNLHITGDEAPFAKSALLALYRVAQEGLTNIAKHAAATKVDLTVTLEPTQAVLVLTDNGKGVDLDQLAAKNASGTAHFGLIGLRERLETVGGTMTISSRKNKGTTLHISVPPQGLT